MIVVDTVSKIITNAIGDEETANLVITQSKSYSGLHDSFFKLIKDEIGDTSITLKNGKEVKVIDIAHAASCVGIWAQGEC